MNITFIFLVNSVLLGVGLIAGVFAVFQAVMPMLGWICVHNIIQYFTMFEKLIPWIALILLCYIGGKMLIEGIRGECQENKAEKLEIGTLFIQGGVTSIDALSVGFTISEYNWGMALLCAAIIAIVTFGICVIGLILGKKFGTKFAGKASILDNMK